MPCVARYKLPGLLYNPEQNSSHLPPTPTLLGAEDVARRKAQAATVAFGVGQVTFDVAEPRWFRKLEEWSTGEGRLSSAANIGVGEYSQQLLSVDREPSGTSYVAPSLFHGRIERSSRSALVSHGSLASVGEDIEPLRQIGSETVD